MNRIVIIGGGASGMMAACAAAQQGAEVVLLEKNEKLGKKIYITGKGRCNFTNCCDTDDFFSNIPRNPRFLYSSVRGFDAEAVRNWFEERGVRTKVERGNRAFPMSDHASDITRGLESEMRRLGVQVRLHAEVKKLILSTPVNSIRRVTGVVLSDGTKIDASCVIVATGGLSYPATGSTGDGFRFAEEAGHKVTARTPSLVPMNTKEPDILLMQGLSLKNVTLTIRSGKKKLYSGFGEMMFTHFGITGPLVLSASADIQDQIRKGELNAEIDLKPALEEDKLNARILREFGENSNKAVRNVVSAVSAEAGTGTLDQTFCPDAHIPSGVQRSGHNEGRGRCKRDRSVHNGLKTGKRALLCRRGAGCGWIYRRIQPADRMVHGTCCRRSRSRCSCGIG